MNKPNCLCNGRSDIRCEDCHCDIAGPGRPGEANECRVCWLRLRDLRRVATGIVWPPSIEWVSTSQLAADVLALLSKLPANLSGIVGIPRSGMIAAAILATHLQLPLYELPPESDKQRPLGWGSRGRILGWASNAAKTLLVVDDTIYGGAAMRRAREQMRGQNALFAAVYPIASSAGQVDFYGRILPDIQLLEWNVFNNGPWIGNSHPLFGAGVACDFDGILCRDPIVPDADDGSALDAYINWLENAPPLWLPRKLPCRLIVTGRLERWRPHTEAWLRRWGVSWERLVMFPASKASERTAADVAALKAREYKASRCGFFLESDPWQAEEIMRLSGKPTICPAQSKVWMPPRPAPATRPGEVAAAGFRLGDKVEGLLTSIGVTKERVEKWLGKPCGCTERQKKLNDLSAWAENAASVAKDQAVSLLSKILGV